MESEPARGLRWGLVLRAVVPVLLLALIGSVVVLVPDWMWTLPLDQRRRVIETFLRGVLVVYFLGLVAGSVGTPLLGWLAFRSWRRGQFRPWPGKTALACWGTLVALIGAEAGAALWNAWVHRTPTLPTRFPEPTPAGQVRLAVLGESSAAGELYQPWLSVGKILAWQLQEAIPGTTYVAEVLAEPGVTLERMHQKLEGLRQRPDAVIVYCGHNEFQARFDWARRVGVSEVPSSRLLRALYGGQPALAALPTDLRADHPGPARRAADGDPARSDRLTDLHPDGDPGDSRGLPQPARGDRLLRRADRGDPYPRRSSW